MNATAFDPSALDVTHDPAARSWLASAHAEGGDFPVQNLPFGVFRRAGSGEPFRGGVAIGDQIVDLRALAASGALSGLAGDAARACAAPVLNDFLAMGRVAWHALRHALFDGLRVDASAADPADAPASVLANALAAALVPQAAAEHAVPTHIGDYTDFYTSYHHALNIGNLFGITEVAPNFHHLPVAYHGRASSVVVSGTPVRRPVGQSKAPDAAAPSFGPCAWLDHEVELGVVVGTGNPLGSRVPLRDAEAHVFGLCLLNDWSARDIQSWEMLPLGPFLAKNFATSISPWIVTLDALAPYRGPWSRASEFPQPLPYLDDPAMRARGTIDVRLAMGIETPSRREAAIGPAALTATSFRHQHWTIGQMLAHHTVGGCNLQPGDLLGSGTISGPTAGEAGAMMELTQAGRRPVRFDSAAGRTEERGFLVDGDSVVLRGWCERAGFARIGFGECRGTILPALPFDG